MKSTHILGLGGSVHDFAACIVRDGEVLCAIEEERLTRRKYAAHDRSTFRCKAVASCLAAAKLHDEPEFIIGNDIIESDYYHKYKDRIVLMNHHLSHAAGAYYLSQFENADILVLDGRGSYAGMDRVRETITGYRASAQGIKEFVKMTGRESEDYLFVENSVGMFYQIATEAVGYMPMYENRTLGLSARGTGKYLADLYPFYSMEDGLFRQTFNQIAGMRSYLAEILSRCRSSSEHLQEKANIAFAAQAHLEGIVVALADGMARKSRSANLCLTGGIAANGAVCTAVRTRTSYQTVFIPPVPGDAGTAIGSALYGYYGIRNHRWMPRTSVFQPAVGPAYWSKDYKAAMELYHNEIRIVTVRDATGYGSKMLARGEIVGWFQGRSEIGPRAVGNRNLFAGPRNVQALVKLRRLKGREPYQGFGCLVLEEAMDRFFEFTGPSDYMTHIASLRHEHRATYPAIIHCNGTTRIQSVSRSRAPRLYALLNDYYEKTGDPMLLSTSLNGRNEPIAETPADAMKFFSQADIHHMIMGPYAMEKRMRMNERE